MPVPSSLEQPLGFRSHLQAEIPPLAKLRPFPLLPAGYTDTMLLLGG